MAHLMTGYAAILLIAALAQQPAIDKAWDLLSQNRKAEVATLLRTELQTHPTNAEAHLLLGSILAESGDTAAAVTHLREAVRLRPKDAMAHNALGEALTDAGDRNAARQAFESALKIYPQFAQAHENLGTVLLDLGDLPGAASHLDRAIQLLGPKPDAAYARYLRGKVYMQSGDLDQAERQFAQAVQLRPDLAEAWSDLGQTRRNLGNDSAALTALQRAVKTNPNGAVAQTRLGSLLLQLGRPAEALAPLEQAVRLSPQDQTALNTLQLALRQTGQTAKADQVKAQLATILQKRDESAQRALEAVRINNQGAELEKQGNLAAAAEKYRAAVDLNPNHAGIRVNYAVALLKLGRWQPGLDQLRTAIRLDPTNETYQRALQDALAQAPANFRRTQ